MKNMQLMKIATALPTTNLQNLISILVNSVLTWLYVGNTFPGSTFFLVWSQDMNGNFYEQSGPLLERYQLNFPDKAHNVFMLKYTYRFIL